MAILQHSKRCKLFEKIAVDIWSLVIRNHRTRTQVNEPGVTNNIIAEIRDNVLSNPNIGVWSNNGFKEIDHGSDVDIFVETVPGVYIWWALQAKVLRLNQRYEGVSSLHKDEYQWDKLGRLSKISGCVSRYLLYNGVKDFTYNGIDRCSRAYNESQFGCSLVKIEDFKSIAKLRNPSFSDFHPVLAEPWRIITCCINSIEGKKITLFNSNQIKSAVKYYPESTKTVDFIREFERNQSVNNFSENFINEISNELGRKSEFSIVIRSTESLNFDS